jgi:hypothetical protein
MTKDLSDRFPPGFAAKRYRATPEQIERNTREAEIQFERSQRARQKLIDEGRIPPDPKPDEKKG